MGVLLQLLDCRDDQGRNLWKLMAPYSYRVGPGCCVTVPAGYVTNFGTVPRLFYRLVSPAELREAALIHDYLCNEDFDGADDRVWDSGYSRWMADAVLFEAMTQIQIGRFRRLAVWIAVRSWAVFSGQK